MKNIIVILLFLISCKSYGQFAVTKRFEAETPLSLCSSQIIFDSLGYFFKEYGCEGESTVSVGRYVMEGNRINLYYLPHDSIPLIQKIHYSNERPSDSTIYVRMIDRFSDSLAGERGIIYASPEGPRDIFSYPEKTLILKYKEAALVFPELNALYKINDQDSIIEIALTPKSMDIYFNLPGYYFIYNCTEDDDKHPRTEMLFINRGLYSMDGKTQYYTLE